MDFNTTCSTVYPMHALWVQQYLDLSYCLWLHTPGYSLHSRVKYFITHNLIVIFSKGGPILVLVPVSELILVASVIIGIGKLFNRILM